MITAISLFSSGGIGDLALAAVGAEVLVANELLPDRAALFAANFPQVDMIVGDIWDRKGAILSAAKRRLGGRPLDLLLATPPCQGMSKNGQGKLLQGVRNGDRPSLDARNQLILPVIDIAKALLPDTIVMENVPEMANTIIETGRGVTGLLDHTKSELGKVGYVSAHRVVEFADYGVPQRRQRLITVFSRNSSLSQNLRIDDWLPSPTHGKAATIFVKPWVSVDSAIGHIPALDAIDRKSASSETPLHRVPLLDAAKYFWVSNTPPGAGAFDNQCVSPTCGFQGNPVHGTARNADGVNQSRKCTPVRCVKCGELLPRPWVKHGDDYKIMSGFTSAYKRMRGDMPASALTRNLSYACSDQKVHPQQNRVLSLLEATIIHSIDRYDYAWNTPSGRAVSDKTIRDVIGESIPPAGLEIILRRLVEIMRVEAFSAAA